ncbi:MAG: mandelate racemase [Intrasporangium sp.]|uniref:enolase C-terminal domain-like protein n=1 Tax=Intrasporangium sp. TaxID=1925024 RepID=UPI002648C4E9|nr:enolase C-terminal domain-like protein [Intrasporangium sp.]MDN5796841.1 mandelate racemase [Intrasporangium sp.]
MPHRSDTSPGRADTSPDRRDTSLDGEHSPAVVAATSARIEHLTCRVLTIPTDAPEADGTIAWDSTTMVLVAARSGEKTGIGWTYGPSACAAIIRGLYAPLVVGSDAMSVPRTWGRLVKASRNDTRPGVVGYALSAVDTALWDLKARLLGVSLADLFGRVRDDVPVYGSGGFTTYDDARTAEQLAHWAIEQRIPRVKIKIGESWGNRMERDVHRIQLARKVIGEDTQLFVDANGGYTAKQAIRLMRDVRDARVTWFEEPVSSDDLHGLALVRGMVEADVAAGEYGSDVGYFERMCAAGAVDCLQVDATRAGGYTAWLQAIGVAAGHGLQVSGHCAPNVHAPVAAATANLRHLEWFHDHVRIEAMLFEGALDPTGGAITPDPLRPGNGLTLREDVAAHYDAEGA